MRNVLPFPKREGFTKKDVTTFRGKELDFPKAWELKENQSHFMLVFNERKAKQFYVKKRKPYGNALLALR